MIEVVIREVIVQLTNGDHNHHCLMIADIYDNEDDDYHYHYDDGNDGDNNNVEDDDGL